MTADTRRCYRRREHRETPLRGDVLRGSAQRPLIAVDYLANTYGNRQPKQQPTPSRDLRNASLLVLQ